MPVDTHREQSRMAPVPAAAPRGRLFDGLTWKGVALIALLALLHSLRRNITEVFDLPLPTWLHNFGEATVTGLIAMLLVMVVVVAIYNRVSAAPRWRYPALVLGIVIASLVGTAISRRHRIERYVRIQRSRRVLVFREFMAALPRRASYRRLRLLSERRRKRSSRAPGRGRPCAPHGADG
jgi:hypothetical protein